MQNQSSVGFPHRTEVIAVVVALLPFVVSFASYSYSTTNGQITEFHYSDPAAIVLGLIAVAVALSNLRLLGQSQPGQTALHVIALVAVLLLGGYDVLHGFGVFIDPQAFMGSQQPKTAGVPTLIAPTPHVNTPAATTLNANQLLYMAKDSVTGNAVLSAVNTDGSNPMRFIEDWQRTTDDPDFLDMPARSPDGSKIAYIHYGAYTGIWVSGLDGMGLRQITKDAGDRQPAWSPDGKRLAFIRKIPGGTTVFAIDTDGSHLTPITDDSSSDYDDPQWSPDGKQVAFYGRRGSLDAVHRGIWIRDADGKNEVTVIDYQDPQVYINGLDWSPDGKTLAFVRWEGDKMELWTVKPDGSKPTNLTPGKNFLYDPAWSPDSKQLAFIYNDDKNGYVLYLIDADGSNMTRVIDVRDNRSGPEW
jgi:Tol biopolymer transport system component